MVMFIRYRALKISAPLLNRKKKCLTRIVVPKASLSIVASKMGGMAAAQSQTLKVQHSRHYHQ